MNRLSTISRSLIVASCALGALIGFTSLASASPPDRTPESGDDRATAHPGNVVGQDCSELFPGSTAVDDVRFEGGDNTAGLDITSVPDGIEIAGVIVKGGPAYNVYSGLGDLPWLDLHAPLVPSGEPAAVSHWFVCGVEKKNETPTPPETEGPGEPGSPGSPGSTGTSAPQGDVSPAAEEDELAATGVASGPLVALGAVLLLGGGALVLLMRTRGARR
jgi:hypothetical protein